MRQLVVIGTCCSPPPAEDHSLKPEDPTKFYERTGYSPYASRNYAERFYFGDEHPKAWSMSAAAVAAARPD